MTWLSTRRVGKRLATQVATILVLIIVATLGYAAGTKGDCNG